MFCGFCKKMMLSSPISKRLAQRFAALIPQGHLAGADEHILSIGSEETFEQFQNMIDKGRIQLVRESTIMQITKGSLRQLCKII